MGMKHHPNQLWYLNLGYLLLLDISFSSFFSRIYVRLYLSININPNILS
ncbi:hypothetical protein ACMBCN_02625 [Candidatus Liberibacter asiaticus]|nr:hypothetical protein [Candidatus Liberibacter asiaticus]